MVDIRMKNKKLVILLFMVLIINPISTTGAISKKKYSCNIELSVNNRLSIKNQLSFAAFSDTHIGAKYQYPQYRIANNLDKICKDLVDNTNFLDFVIHLGDIVNHNTGHVNGNGLPWYVNKYKNNLKDYLINNLNLPFHVVFGNHDLNDYEMNQNDPHNLTKSLINELSMNSPVYAMMRDGILFLVVPELGYVQWTHPVIYEWVEFMTQEYSNSTTIILCHQAIEDTTEDYKQDPYRGKQDMEWWANLFKKNPQIKMWINGHNHFLDWYISDKSSGETSPVQDFGHEIAFSAPYPQLDIYLNQNEDRVVIYNINSTGITTAAWQNNGFGGCFVSEYCNTWKIPTTFNPETEDWYVFSMFLQDNETQITDMKIISPDVTLQLVGMPSMELFYDSKMESPNSKVGEIILGFGNDRYGNVENIEDGMRVHGPTSICFPEKKPHEDREHEDGRSGPPYQRFPMGTICAAVPNQTYNFTITARCNSSAGRFNMSINCTDWSTRSQYSTLSSSQIEVISHVFGPDYETIQASYTVPDNENSWFLQGELNFIDSCDYDVSLFSVKRNQNSNTTDDFCLNLSGYWYNVSGPIYENEIRNFSLDPAELCDKEGVMNFTALIDGNKFGMVNLKFKEPILLCRNARFYLKSVNENVFNIILTDVISKSSKYFEIYPYSTDSQYRYLNIKTNDNSGNRHISKNGNIWLTCCLPLNDNCNIEISLNGGIIKKPKQEFFYISNEEIGPTIFENTFVIGDINIEVNVSDYLNVSKVEFFIDDEKIHEEKNPPFEFLWNKIKFFKHTIMVKTYYENGFVSEDRVNLWKFL
jgi:hypothetical protein